MYSAIKPSISRLPKYTMTNSGKEKRFLFSFKTMFQLFCRNVDNESYLKEDCQSSLRQILIYARTLIALCRKLFIIEN